MTKGRCTTAFSSDFPQNRPRARTSATAIPTGRLVSIAQNATRNDSRIATSSSGEKSRSALTRLGEHGEALGFERGAGRGTAQIGGEGSGVGVLAAGDKGQRVEDRGGACRAGRRRRS